jgi:hypothetical protein
LSGFGVVLFHTTSAAFRGEKVVRGAGWEAKLIPTPRQLSSDCGIALRFDWKDEWEIRRVLEKAAVENAGIYKLD